MALSRIRVGVAGALLGGALVALSGCPSSNGGAPDAGAEKFDRRTLLAGLAEHVFLERARAFVPAAEALRTASEAYAADRAAARRDAARSAWRAAMATWQELEPMQVGPAGVSTVTTRGEGLRDEIYSWPVVNPCRVDQEVVSKNYANANFFQTALVNVYGLDAIEYLLFAEGDQNACAPQAAINADGSWAALGADERAKRRAEYAAAAAAHVVTMAKRLQDAWDPAKGNFVAQLSKAGGAGSEVKSVQDAVDQVFAAMFFVDLTTKDQKLAAPAALDGKCAGTVCPEKLESRFAKFSKEEVAANLRGLRRLLTGGAPADTARIGFDDWLVALGAGAFASQLVGDLDAAIVAVEAVPGTFDESLARGPAELKAAHAAVKKVTDAMKSTLVTTLSLKVPQEGAADND